MEEYKRFIEHYLANTLSKKRTSTCQKDFDKVLLENDFELVFSSDILEESLYSYENIRHMIISKKYSFELGGMELTYNMFKISEIDLLIKEYILIFSQ